MKRPQPYRIAWPSQKTLPPETNSALARQFQNADEMFQILFDDFGAVDATAHTNHGPVGPQGVPGLDAPGDDIGEMWFPPAGTTVSGSGSGGTGPPGPTGPAGPQGPAGLPGLDAVGDDAGELWAYTGGTTVLPSGAPGTIVITLGITIDGGSSVITTGAKGYRQVMTAGTITGWSILAKQVGSITFDVVKDPFASYPPTTSIVAAAPPTMTTDDAVQSSSLTGWTTAVAAGDVFGFSVTSVTAITRVTLELKIEVPAGPTGPIGATGATGPTGAAGLPGPPGLDGSGEGDGDGAPFIGTSIYPITSLITTALFSVVTGSQLAFTPGLAPITVIEWSGGSDATFGGLVGGLPGYQVTFWNFGSYNAYFTNQEVSAAVGTQFINPVSSAPIPIAPGGSISYEFDGTYWLLTAHNQGAWITPPFNAANFSSSSGSWTIGAPAVVTNAYTLTGNTLIWQLYVSWLLGSNVISGSPGQLYLTVPGNLTLASPAGCSVPYLVDVGAATQAGIAFSGGTFLAIQNLNSALFTNTFAAGFLATFTFQVL